MTLMENARAITIHVKSEDLVAGAHRTQVAERVQDYFEKHFPAPLASKVLCFLDDIDSPELKGRLGSANRGLHWPIIKGQGLVDWPQYMWDLIAPTVPGSSDLMWPFDSVIYLHGTTCETDIGLTLTLAHELQHFLQYANSRRVWAINTLLLNLPALPTEHIRVMWDIPIEIEARIVAKQVAETLYGCEPVATHVADRIRANVTPNDVEDWRFFQGIDASQSYSVIEATRSLVNVHISQLKEFQRQAGYKDDSDFSAIDFDNDQGLA